MQFLKVQLKLCDETSKEELTAEKTKGGARYFYVQTPKGDR
ncbi:hypothetical protein [Caldicellulosiruptor changbaiensis]|nr:hypothetical protein [Caldicellulosiruptor changbaiensis]